MLSNVTKWGVDLLTDHFASNWKLETYLQYKTETPQAVDTYMWTLKAASFVDILYFLSWLRGKKYIVDCNYQWALHKHSSKCSWHLKIVESVT